jgi:CubicO group peptidase (beta-lactamase class C family)
MKYTKISILLVVALLCVGQSQAQTKVEAFDNYVEAARKEWKVPGMSLVVVQDGKVLLSKGYGVKELGKNDAVDSRTIFGAMSTTKAMTAVAMGILVDEGKVNWNDKVVDHLPGFKVNDAYLTSQLKVRDLLTHNAGMGNTDILWALGFDYSGDEIMRRMQYVTPAYSLRGGFVYQNVMYLVAGKVIEKASGMSWERFMAERVFGPLGMKNTFATFKATQNYANRSLAHYEIDGQIRTIPEMSVDEAGAAGSVWSTSDDMGIWMNFLIANANVGGKPLLTAATMGELFKPQVILPSTFYPTFRITRPKWTTYGLGWFQHDYRGWKVDLHTGSLAGRTAIVGLIRDKKLGVYIFGNVDHAEVRHALMYKVFDTFGFDDAMGRDWSAEFKSLYDGIASESAKQTTAQMSANLKGTKPSRPLSAYAGKYSDDFVGNVEVRFVNGKLRFIISDRISADLEHRQVDTFHVNWDEKWRGQSLAVFELSPINGDVVSLNIAGQTLRRVPPNAR